MDDIKQENQENQPKQEDNKVEAAKPEILYNRVYLENAPKIPHLDITPNHLKWLEQVKAEAQAKRERRGLVKCACCKSS